MTRDGDGVGSVHRGSPLLLLATSCSRSGLYLYPDADAGEPSVSGAGGTSFDSGGAGAFGGASAGTAPSGGRPSGGSGSGGSLGGTNGRGGTSGSAGTAGSVGLGRICPAVAGENLEQPMLSLLSQGELLLVRGNGSTFRVNANAAQGAQIWKEDRFLFLAKTVEDTLMLSLVDRAGNVLWSHSGPPDPVEPERVFVDSSGNAAILMTGDEAPGVAVLVDGRARKLPAYPKGPPDEFGWVPVVERDWLGFVNASTGEIRRASLPPAQANYAPLFSDGRFVYLSMGPVGPGVSALTLFDERYFPLGDLDPAAILLPTDVGAVVLEHNVPRALLNGSSLTLYDLGWLERDPAFEHETTFRSFGQNGLLVEGQVPRYRIDLRNGVATRLAPAPYEPRHEVTHVVMNENWAVGATSRATPLFWVNLTSASVGRADFAPLTPLRPLDESDCAPLPLLLDDGSLALGLRDDSSAGLYVGELTRAPWRRLGRHVANVVAVGATRYPQALVVAASSGRNTFCGGGAWPRPESVPEGTLLGDSVQIVMQDLPDTEVAFADHDVSEFVFHESGLCAAVRGFVQDFPSGERTALPPDASQVTFW